MPVHGILVGLNGWGWCELLSPENIFWFRTVWYVEILEPFLPWLVRLQLLLITKMES